MDYITASASFSGARHAAEADLSDATTILVMLGNAIMAEGLSELLQSQGYRCFVGESHGEPDVIIVDTATINDSLTLRFPKARIFFLQTDQDPKQVAALVAWHKVHAVIPPSTDLQGFKKALKVVHEEQVRGRRARSDALTGTEVPLPFTRQEKKVFECICRGDTVKEMAQSFHLSPYTVKAHVHSILAKTGAPNRACLVNLLGARCAEGVCPRQ
ncbi:MAG TPA: LuxR C-terminal-related transcriptional regulator [Syntrophorhabdales bacterium]|nr:LuxR C-terminal-related transcriptional regulator [Syntrophorhabdales bacterium]